MDRCWPDIPAIIERTAAARELWESGGKEKIDRLYIMTNGQLEFVDELKKELWKLGDWIDVTSSRDLKLTRAQKYIAQSMDMAIAERAALFIGNGVCFFLRSLLIGLVSYKNYTTVF